jgi:hypothetical protein
MSNCIERFRPEITKGNDDLDNLYSVEKSEIDVLNSKIRVEIDNNYLESCNLDGMTRWENLYKQKHNYDYSLAQGKELLRNYIIFKPPFTKQRLQEIFETIWGVGNYTFVLYPETFELIVDIYTTDPIVYLKFKKDVRNVIPANIYLIFSIQYTYLYLNRNFTYNQLEELTYGDLSQYA